jgi:hypothetical protein
MNNEIQDYGKQDAYYKAGHNWEKELKASPL